MPSFSIFWKNLVNFPESELSASWKLRTAFSAKKYPNIPPSTDPTVHTSANRNQPAGIATTIAINNTSGGMGKNDDSINEMMNNAGIA